MKIVIVGAGAAGLMCACKLNSNKYDIIVLEKNFEVGQKLLLTGNSRCNITNLVSPKEFLESVPRNPEFLSSCIHNFTPQDMVDFLRNELQIETKTESANRVFPALGGAKAVRDALRKYAKANRVGFDCGDGACVKTIKQHGVKFQIQTDEETFLADVVVIATGGLSFPKTGSTGDGYDLAQNLGYDIEPTRPSLCGVRLESPTGIQGVSVYCSVKLDGVKSTGDMMFTSEGLSGPVIFDAVVKFEGRDIAGEVMEIDFAPNLSEREISFDSRDKLFYALRNFVPASVANWLAKLNRTADPMEVLKSTKVVIENFEDIKTAIVTRGGVDVNNINPETMEGKLAKGLYFIGEVLDVDGLYGGFNLQIAASTAVAATKHINKLS